jgi:hypothetical protein
VPSPENVEGPSIFRKARFVNDHDTSPVLKGKLIARTPDNLTTKKKKIRRDWDNK